MKKQVTILSGLVLLAGTSFAQQALNIPAQKAQPVHIAPYNGVVTKAPAQTRAGGDVIFSDDFSNASNWTIGTGAGTQGTFIIGDNTHTQISNSTSGLNPYMGNMASPTAANGFAFFNGVQYLIGGSVDPQNTWVASQTIDFTGITSAILSFKQRYRAFNSDVTLVEFSNDGGATWTFSEIVNGAVPTNAAAVQNTITLNIPVNGAANGMIRFRWENLSDDNQFGSGYGWMVDDVEILEGYDNNLQLGFTYSAVGAQILQYTQMPVAQTASAGNISFGAEVKNVGNNPQDVQLHVTSGAYDQTGSAVTINPFASDSVSIVTANGMAIPTTVGVSNFTFEVVSNNTLDETADDTGTAPFQVTANTYAVDKYNGTTASLDSYFTQWSSASGAQGIGTLFELFESAEVGAVDVCIGNVGSSQQATFIGREFYAQIFQFNAATQEFDYVDETPTHALVAADFGKIVKLKMVNNTISLVPGLYLVVASSFDAAPVPVAFSGYSIGGNTIGMNGDNFVTLASDDATPNIVEAPVVRLDFQSYVGIDELANLSGVTAAPNPFSNATEISFDLATDATIAVVVTDLAGREVMNIPASNFAAGSHKVSLDGSSLNAGVYNYTLKIGNSVVTKRIVKK